VTSGSGLLFSTNQKTSNVDYYQTFELRTIGKDRKTTFHSPSIPYFASNSQIGIIPYLVLVLDTFVTPYETAIQLKSYYTPFLAKKKFQSHKSSFRWTVCLAGLQVYGETGSFGMGRPAISLIPSIDTWLTWRFMSSLRSYNGFGPPHGNCGEARTQIDVQSSSSSNLWENSPAYLIFISRDLALLNYLETNIDLRAMVYSGADALVEAIFKGMASLLWSNDPSISLTIEIQRN